nr:methyltransferase-like protein 5 [Tanacetum cinerariifolium]
MVIVSAIGRAENSFEDISGKVVADFRCGCGTLGLAATLLDVDHVIGVDMDEDSLEIASINADVASQAVYSLHKTTTREHIKRAALRDYNAASAEVIC